MTLDTLLEAESWFEHLGETVVLKGVAASVGCASGKARVLTTPDDVQIARGEILVLPDLRSAWWPLFSTASAVVAAQGAILSPAATLAREYGLPMVVGVPNAIQGILTGRRIAVDGERGLVSFGGRRWEF
jgi:phosphohistidine swiveling domain-containing protein